MASKKKATPSSSSSRNLRPAKTFTWEEIENITQNFGSHIGQGGYADVYKAESFGQQLAVKVYRTENEEQQGKQWEAEISRLSQLRDNNHIVKLIGYGIGGNGRLCLVLEYIPYKLEDLLEDLSWEQTLKVISQVASALAYIHSQSLVLVDLKIENIMLTEANDAKIVDFGSVVSEKGDILTLTNECASAETIKDGKGMYYGDVFSLGVLILQLIMKSAGVGHFTNPTKKLPHSNQM